MSIVQRLGTESRLFESTERVAEIGTWQWCPATGELLWSDNLFRLFGLAPGETEPSTEFVLERAHPDDRTRVQLYLQSVAEGDTGSPIELRVVLPGVGVRHLRSIVALVEQGSTGSLWISGVIRDITEQSWAERELEVHVAVSASLAEWERLEPGAKRLLSRLARALSFEIGVLWLPQHNVLLPRVVWQDGSLDQAMCSSILGIHVGWGSGLAGRAWESGEPTIVTDLLDDDGYEPYELAVQVGLHGALAIPALDGKEVLAVLGFVARAPVEPSDRLRSTLGSVGSELGQFLSRRQSQLLPSSELTPRELEILQLAAHGQSVQDIAERLSISASTVKTYVRRTYCKLGVSNRASAVATGLRTGLIT
jgi:DNA-binding NarL/FixJ family response regulator